MKTQEPNWEEIEATITGGEDTCYVTIYGEYGSEFPSVAAKLERTKELAATKGSKRLAPIEINGRTFYVESGGRRPAAGRYRKHLCWSAGIQFQIIGAMGEASPEEPIAICEVGSDALMQFGGVDHAWGEIQSGLYALEIVPTSNRLTRVDFALDLPGVDVSALTEPFWAGQFVCRARRADEYQASTHLGTFGEYDPNAVASLASTGFTIGRAIRFRWYDKLRETEGSKNDQKRKTLIDLRWGGKCPLHASRAEFQLRSESLRSYHVHDVYDWINLRADIVGRLYDHVRFTTTENTGNNRKHLETHPLWACLQNAAARLLGDPRQCTRRKYVPSGDPIHCQRRGFASIFRGIALSGGNPTDYEQLQQAIFDQFEMMADRDGHTVVCERFRKHHDEIAKRQIPWKPTPTKPPISGTTDLKSGFRSSQLPIPLRGLLVSENGSNDSGEKSEH